LTPDALAEYMAELLVSSSGPVGPIRSLDPGAGAGALTRALVDRASSQGDVFQRITLVESDSTFTSSLFELQDVALKTATTIDLHLEDFIDYAGTALTNGEAFTHIIMNPPYRKLRSLSEHDIALKHLGVNVTNYYAAFLWLAIDLLQPQGRLVTVIPRSFMNGAMFAGLRRHLLSNTSIEQITTFDSRDVFARDSVLQEIVVLSLRKSIQNDASTRFVQADTTGPNIQERSIFSTTRGEYLLPLKEGHAITIPVSPNEPAPPLGSPLIGHPFDVRTGSVVDFRHRQNIVDLPGVDTVPLIGSAQLALNSTAPLNRFLKVNDQTRRFVRPPGHYVIIKRISPPEQVPRIRARTIDTRSWSNTGIAFENHVNYICRGPAALSSREAAELLAALTHQDTENQFARLSGTTQVNVTDLRLLRHPNKENGSQ